MNGELVDWDAARIHVLTHTLHYGMGVFEGVRAYETEDGPAVFATIDTCLVDILVSTKSNQALAELEALVQDRDFHASDA